MASFHNTTLDAVQWPTTSALIDEDCGPQGNGLQGSEGPLDDSRVLFFGLYYWGQPRADWEREYPDLCHPPDPRSIGDIPTGRVRHGPRRVRERCP